MRRKVFLTALLGVFAAGAAGDLRAAEDWDFRIAPYVWTAGLSGEIGPAGRTASVNMSFKDILEMTELALAASFDAVYRDDWTFVVEGLYLDMKEDATGPGGADVKVGIDEVLASARAMKRVAKNLDLGIGATYLRMDAEASSEAAGASAGSTQEWVDPTVVLRVTGEVSEKMFLRLGMSYGGFGINSDSLFELVANLNYRFNETFSGVFGYRLVDYDYDKDGFVYNARMDGLTIGLGISW